MQPGDYSKKHDRGLVEKQRRREMKNLYSTLGSLISPPPLKSNQEKLPVPALIDQSVEYLKHLKERVDGLKARKKQLQAESSTSTEGLVQPAVVMNENGPILEVNLVTGLNKGFMLHKVISILEEEGAEVLSANYSTSTDHRILYTITSQAFSTRIGIETSRVYERLKTLSAA